MKKILLVCLIGLILFSANGFCYILEGNSAIEEGNGLRIEVTPHTASSPVKNYKQEFSFTNTSEQDLAGVRVVYYFNGQPKIKMQQWNAPEYKLIEYSESFDSTNHNWTLTETENELNPLLANVYTIDDTNGTPENVLIWQYNVKNTSECTEGQCFYWDQEVLASGNEWQDSSFYEIGKTEIDGETVWYYYSDEFNLSTGETANWKIKYTVSKNTGKWTLALIKGTPNCLITNTCEEQWVLDPWWENNNWKYRKKITLKTSDYLTADVSNDHAILVNIDSTQTNFWTNVDSTGKDIRFVSSDGATEYDYHFERFDSDNDIMIAWVEITDTFTSASDLAFYIYYGNDSVSDAQNEEGTYPSTYTAVYHMADDDSTAQSDSTGNGHGLTLENTPTDESSGKIAESVAFDRASSEYARSDSLMNAETDKFTISKWFMEPAGYEPGETYHHYMLYKYTNGIYKNRVDWYLEKISGKIQFAIVINNAGSEFPLSTNDTWDAGVWYHLVVVVDTTITNGSFKVYINGAEDEACTIDKDWGGNWQYGTLFGFRLNAGPTANWGTQSFDEIKVLHGTAWSADEVKLIYASENTDLVEIGAEESFDNDGDGIIDPLDECPATPLGEAVDAVGCSCSQKTCDDGNPCSDNVCDLNSAECVFANDNTNICGFERDCTGSTCILKEEPPYFYWKLFPDDGHDYCYDGNCTQYSCDLVSEDFNATCSFANTNELEAKVEEMESKITQLEQQNLNLQGQLSILEASLNAMQNAFESFVAIVDSYLFNLPKGLRQGMLCGALEQSGELNADGFGLHCEISEQGKCNCSDA